MYDTEDNDDGIRLFLYVVGVIIFIALMSMMLASC